VDENNIAQIANLVRARNAIDQRIAAIIGRQRSSDT